MSEQDAEAMDLQAAVIPVTGFQQNCTLFWAKSSKAGVVIDPGGELDRIMGVIEDQEIRIEKLVLTHGHIDHAGGAAELSENLGVPIIGPHRDDKFLLDGLEQQAVSFGLEGVRNCEPSKWLDEGDVLEMAGCSFNVLHCPGHSPGSVVFHQPELRFLIAGDVLFQGSIGRTDLPGGDHEALIRSIKEKLFPLGDEVSFICGHGPGSTIGRERASNPFLA